jgi:hypothetical protein
LRLAQSPSRHLVCSGFQDGRDIPARGSLENALKASIGGLP